MKSVFLGLMVFALLAACDTSKTDITAAIKLDSASAAEKKRVQYTGLGSDVQKIFEPKIDKFYECVETRMKEEYGTVPVYAPIELEFDYEKNIVAITSRADMDILRPRINNGLGGLKTKGIYRIRNFYVGITNICMSFTMLDIMRGLLETHPDLARQVMKRAEIHTIYKNDTDFWMEEILCDSDNNCFVTEALVNVGGNKTSIQQGRSTSPHWFMVDNIKDMSGNYTENYAALKFWEIQP